MGWETKKIISTNSIKNIIWYDLIYHKSQGHILDSWYSDSPIENENQSKNNF
jgi:hypothetical protein